MQNNLSLFTYSIITRYIYIVVGLALLTLFAFNNMLSVLLFILVLYYVIFSGLASNPINLLYFFILTVPFIGMGIGITTSRGLLLMIPFIVVKYYQHICKGIKLLKRKFDPIIVGVILMGTSFILSLMNAIKSGNFNINVISQTGQIVFEILILLLVVSFMKDMHTFDKILHAIKIPASIFSIAIIVYLAYNGFGYLFSIKHIMLLTADINANLSAMMITPLVMLIFADVKFNKSIVINPLYYLLVVICLTAVVFTNSRGAWVGLFCAFAYFIIRSKKYKIAIFAMLIIFLLSVTAGDAVIKRFSQTNIQEQGMIIRFILWSVAIRYMISNPLLGLGPDLFRIEKNKFGFLSLWDPEKILSSHNMYLEIGVNFGGMALVGFVLISIYLLWKIDKMHRDSLNKKYKQYLLATNAALITILVHGFFDCGIANIGIAFVIALVFGLAIAIVRNPEIFDMAAEL